MVLCRNWVGRVGMPGRKSWNLYWIHAIARQQVGSAGVKIRWVH